MLERLFELAGGTIVGRDHSFSGRPLQDAFVIGRREDRIVGVICDGCGDPTSPHSEVSAKIGAQLIASNLLGVPRIDFNWLDIVRQHSLAAIETLAQDMCGQDFGHRWENDPRPKLPHILRDYFLFTVMGFVITPEDTWFFSIGDGTLWVNEEQIPIGPFKDNAPPYMTYALMDSSLLTSEPGCLKFQVRKKIPTECLESFLIGSDGINYLTEASTKMQPDGKAYVGDICQFWSNDSYFRNPDQVRRKLSLINKVVHKEGAEKGHLRDDTTLIACRRRYAGTASLIPEV